MTTSELARAVALMHAIGEDTQTYEVKSSRKRLARNICKTISAFSNGAGGTIICGLCERGGFAPIKDFDAEAICDSLAQACNERMTPPARPEVDILPFEGGEVVVAQLAQGEPRTHRHPRAIARTHP